MEQHPRQQKPGLRTRVRRTGHWLCQRLGFDQLIGVEARPAIVQLKFWIPRRKRQGFLEQRVRCVELASVGFAVCDAVQGLGQKCFVFRGGVFLVARLKKLTRCIIVLLHRVLALGACRDRSKG